MNKESYECYKAIGVARVILSGDPSDSDSLMHDFEYSLRLACVTDQSDKQILVDYFDVLASAANIACEQDSTYFESIYKNLSELAEEHDLGGSLQDSIPNGDAKIEEMAAHREKEKAEKQVTKDNIGKKLQEQEVYCSAPEKRVRDANYKSLYPDYIYIGSVQNDTDKVIRDVVITVGAWDGNGYPVRIHAPYSSTEENLMGCRIADANIQPGDTWTVSDGGWDIAESCTYNATS